MNRRSEQRFSGNFESLQQSRVARGIEEPPSQPTPRIWADFEALETRVNGFVTRQRVYDEMLNVGGTRTFGTRNIGASWIHSALRDEDLVTMAIPRDGLHWNTNITSSKKAKPTLSQVELKLGLTSDMWDTIAPEDLIEAIYELCNT